MGHHILDIYPDPRRVHHLYINEPELIDESITESIAEAPIDNIRVYVPLDLNKEAILRRLCYIRNKYGEVT